MRGGDPFVGNKPIELMKRTAEAVAVIVVNYRTPELAKTCVSSLQSERACFRKLEVILVDGGSADGSFEELSDWTGRNEFRDWVTFLPLPLNGGFGWANNQAIRWLLKRREDLAYVYLLNPDAEIEPSAVKLLAECLNGNPHTAAVGSQLVELDGSRAGSAFTFPSIRGEFARGARTGALDRLLRVPPVCLEPSESVEVDWVTGASVMFRVDALRQVGLFDEGFFLYHEEVELMWRLRNAGWAVATEPKSRVRHVGGSATGVQSRETSAAVQPRKPAYLYRSRTRFFGVTRGYAIALAAFFAWIAGYAVWRLRRIVGLGGRSKPIDHEFRDHIMKAFPRRHDTLAALGHIDGPPFAAPAWIENEWLQAYTLLAIGVIGGTLISFH